MPLSRRRHRHLLAGAAIVLVRPQYPENYGAVARAMRVTGFEHLWALEPGHLVHARHPNARRMAVGATDLLDDAQVGSRLEDLTRQGDWLVGTSARAGIRSVWTPRMLAEQAVKRAMTGQRLVLLFGGEKTGLRRSELDTCHQVVRIPMVGNEPSLNLAQSVMVILYELMVAALEVD